MTRQLRSQAGSWLRELREQRGLAQRDLAERVGIEFYTFISQLENSRGRIPPDRCLVWAEALGVEPRKFLRTLLSYPARERLQDNLRKELEYLNRRITAAEQLVAGWRDLIEMYPNKPDATAVRDLLAMFESKLGSQRAARDLIQTMLQEPRSSRTARWRLH